MYVYGAEYYYYYCNEITLTLSCSWRFKFIHQLFVFIDDVQINLIGNVIFTSEEIPGIIMNFIFGKNYNLKHRLCGPVMKTRYCKQISVQTKREDSKTRKFYFNCCERNQSELHKKFIHSIKVQWLIFLHPHYILSLSCSQ